MKKESVQKKNYLFIGIVFAILIAYTIIMVLMLYLTTITSLKDYLDYKLNPISLPEIWFFSNYVDAFQAFSVNIGERTVYLGEMFFNSFVYSLGSALASTIVPCVVAYLVAKYNVWFNKVIYLTVIVAMTMPIIGALPSEIQIMKAIGFYDNLFGVIVMKMSHLGMYFLIFHATFKSLSNEFIEAATIDGAGQWQVMLTIVFPLIKTTFSAVLLLNFIAFWNDYQSPMIYLRSFPTVAVGLFRYVYMPNLQSTATTNMQMAGCMLLFIPIFILFCIFKDKLMGNLTVGGIKG